MTRVFYIYVAGYDLDDIATELRMHIDTFALRFHGRLRIVDRREDASETSADLPVWELGVNFDFGELVAKEKVELLAFFQGLSDRFGRDFVVGRTSIHGFPEDFVFISPHEPFDSALAVLNADVQNA